MGDLLLDTVLLYFVGLCGWFIFSRLRIPVADVLGSMMAVSLLRMFWPQLPMAPGFISPLIQVFLGLLIGSKITRDKILTLMDLAKPVGIVAVWVVSMAFAAGFLLAWMTGYTLNPTTGILSSAMGGFPEMTILALETDADVAAVVAIKTVRMVLFVVLFPLVFEKWLMGPGQYIPEAPAAAKEQVHQNFFAGILDRYRALAGLAGSWLSNDSGRFIKPLKYGLLSLGISALGGSLFRYLGVPAGGMIGGMFFVAMASVTGVPIKPTPIKLIPFLRVGLGLMIANSITQDTLAFFTSASFILALFVNVLLVFSSFALVTYILYKVTDWDIPTCYLCAAPAGLSIMSTLALKYEKDVFTISIVHLCRLIAIKAVLPFILMRML